MEGFEVIAQGAEARLYKGVYLKRPAMVKERFVKKYRQPDLDTHLTKDRIRAEARALLRAKSAGVATPALFMVNLDRRSIYMEYIDNSIMLKDFIINNISEKPNVDHLIDFVGRGLGLLIARLHSKNIIHGDLTTSNILIKQNFNTANIDKITEDEVANHFVMIDFGLAHVESTVEDKGVDLYVLERSLLSVHSEVPKLFTETFNYYQKYYTNRNQCKEIVAKFKEVQARGRKRLMIG